MPEPAKLGFPTMGVPVVADTERFEHLVACGHGVLTDAADPGGALYAALADESRSGWDAAQWPGCGCVWRCAGCAPFVLVTDGAERAVLTRGAPW